jgi:hydroxysqualene dehydroxylase
MAGLAAALKVSSRGLPVVLHEAAGHAGGRCRSFFDETLGCEIDNGNHLVLSGNSGVAAFVDQVGSAESFLDLPDACFPFIDLETDERWVIHPNRGRLPWWVFKSDRRVPGSRASDYLAALRLLAADKDATVDEIFGENANVYRRFWEPLAVAVLNTPPTEACARLLWPVFAETFALGADACRPLIARQGLTDSFIDPALATLRERGAEIRFGHRLRSLSKSESVVTELHFGDETIKVAVNDSIILALPAAVLGSILPESTPPETFHPIVNVHFKHDASVVSSPLPPILGVIGGTAEWIFCRGDILSVTVSAAIDLANAAADDIADATWRDIDRVLALNTPLRPATRVVKEKRATFAQTPENERRRANTRTNHKNLFLAGDWTNTGLPATIEGAIRSGFNAAKLIKKSY